MIYHLHYVLDKISVLHNLINTIISEYEGTYSNLDGKKIFFVINEELDKFLKAIEKGTVKFEKFTTKWRYNTARCV